VTAVAPVVIRGKGLWVGWSGIHLSDKSEPIPESDPTDNTPTAGLKSDQVRILWFHCHGRKNFNFFTLPGSFS
jgi:hypothetical protein